ncbi:ATP:cob(I)alamin adenosyltransferase [Candidatus Giovannonibacteria bacterium RIFCSPLOWO2_01_FULL_44_16]|uniref:Corrinoid adenosyltransferase n=1 Tax=Candidatus Giovannonibacteria bacterium RIFCSPLOWO2_01_FULL_44_16 TaxID=1798348 RepID=A0A1F5X2M0_9BACT|nr:MAG: ATP:cob(I)alamin adenosyltransferase [Candidatus Giovannonibacteria bacterium RIFCSPLOWO2_01_FULL_44_16]
MRFYSGKGDKGTTTLYGSGKRALKTGKVFELLGTLDELNSYLGICKSLARDKKIKNALETIQENLFIIQADVGSSGHPTSKQMSDVQAMKTEKILGLEKTIDKFGEALGIITKFTLSGDSALSAHLDYARTLARSAERAYLASRTPNGYALAYLNRLSSLLFVLARYVNKKAGKKERNPKYK